ncbi:MAG: hypothetical protein O6914_04180, partial [Chloroflexi bacterium]|nr:hypothetical protein [Chloroflexota bacterium]
MTTTTGVRADGHLKDEITHNLGDKELGKPNKISSDLLALFEEYQGYVSIFGTDSGFQPSNPLLPVVGNRVIIDAVSQGNANDLKNDLKGLGNQKDSGFGRSVSGQLPIMTIKGMESLGRLKFVRPAYMITVSGLVTSQGDVGMRADIARAASGVDGTGVTVGTLSDSFDCLGGAGTDVASGDLPSGIVVLEEFQGCPFPFATDEGRAMMQLIHDVAPGAAQAFHSATNGPAAFAEGIEELATLGGADVIVDDVIYLAETMFQDGIIAQAVDTVEGFGVSY